MLSKYSRELTRSSRSENGMTKTGVAHLAASFLTSRRQAEIADDYVTWIDSKTTAAAAEDALLAASRTSKSPTKVLAAADVFYTEFGGL